MKTIYKKPTVDVTFVQVQQILAGSENGTLPQGGDMSKGNNNPVVVEDEEDEALEEFKPEQAAKSQFFSTDYIKKVWE